MLKQILVFSSALILLAACSKKEPAMATCYPDDITWLQVKKQELSPCTCKTEIRQGTWNNLVAFEIRITDPLCDGINVVYDVNGKMLFYSGATGSAERIKYDAYLSQNLGKDALVWSCGSH